MESTINIKDLEALLDKVEKEQIFEYTLGDPYGKGFNNGVRGAIRQLKYELEKI